MVFYVERMVKQLMEIALIARQTRLFLLDLDGTVYLGERWIDGAREFLNAVTASGRRFAFVTNNASKNTASYLKKFERMGFPVTEEQIIISSHATADYLLKHLPGKRVFVLGTDELKAELAARGVLVADGSDADCALVSFDTGLCYKNLTAICDLVRSGCPYIATHPDLNCPTETGFIPDAGANIAFIKASAGREPDIIIGKPQPALIEYAMNRFGVSPDETAMIGDRIYTDVASGLNAGVCGVLVLSGETTAASAAASPVIPTAIIGSVADITQYL